MTDGDRRQVDRLAQYEVDAGLREAEEVRRAEDAAYWAKPRPAVPPAPASSGANPEPGLDGLDMTNPDLAGWF